MPKVDLGDKQLCPACGAKFYDLKKRPVVCPKCSHAFDPADETVKAKRAKARVVAFQPSDDDEDDVRESAAPRDAAEDEEEETEETAELDIENPEVLPVTDEAGDDEEPAGDDLAEGFSEEELEEPGGDDADVPFLEDEDDDLLEDDLDELPDGDSDDR